MSENAQKINPLMSLMRQPKVYITLPSRGRYYPEGALDPTVNGEYPVYSMTAKDEIILKTPDALMNGQGVADVIHSCMPNIKDPWAIPTIDLDVILVAIRLATYGDKMTLTIKHSTMDDEMEYETSLQEILDQLQSNTTWEERLEIRPDLVIFLKPIDYKTQTYTQMSEFETQKLMSVIRDETLDDEAKLIQFKSSFEKMTNRTIDVIIKAIHRIESSAGTVSDPDFLEEFMRNCDREVFDKIKQRISELNENNELKPLKIASTEEMLAKGAPEFVEIPFSFDTANFFG
jgi:hypothetical protein